ncbi:hypothetical protein [Plesiomonas shigelloides]|uniref:Uncharacterized protein n=1 Tax=Plesiomonas shigelloides 302-73 TaxID=1315976 RepID=R8AVY3_PLESH|nr:hypothetical protein [Plesiomonas shigelloides]EON90483.1 hypothetical protein PLESHI_00230 [Plesiomonas shigelloides 302-73]
MLEIGYEAKSFPKSIYGKSLQGKKSLKTDWNEIVWAAITVGKRNSAQISSNGVFSLYEIINRSTLIWTTLKQNSNKLEQSSVYTSMDPTEKKFVSFSLGMVMSKLFALKLLRVPWLEHVANVNSSISTKTQTKSRPDFIGINKRNEFVIFEAKGRTNNYDASAQTTAKRQTKVIHKISSQKPVLRVACQSYFKHVLEVFIEDPEEVQEQPINIDVLEEDYFKSYYAIFQSLTETELDLLKRLGIEIGFSDVLARAFKTGNYGGVINGHSIKDTYVDNNGFKCFPDGLKIKLDPYLWNNELFELEPERRQSLNK